MTAPTVPPAFDRLQRRSLIAGAAGIALCAVGWLVSRERFFQSYLVAYVFWLGVPWGCLGLAMLHHLVSGAWGLPTSRFFEAGIATLPLMVVLFLPVVLGMEILYPWASQEYLASHSLSGFKAAYLQTDGFLGRALLYFAVWLVCGWLLNRWSLRRDASPDARPVTGLTRLCAGGLLFSGLAVTFAAFDWIMSIEPEWYSTIYGAIIGVGSVVAALAFVITLVAPNADEEPLAGVATARIRNDLGSLLLAFLMIWAYMAFSQYLIIWSGDQPAEAAWYLRRLEGGWEWVALLVALLHFVVPFLLLSRENKRNPRTLAGIACLLLTMHYIDLFWTIAPAYRPDGFRLHWLDVVSPIAVGGVWMAAFVHQLKRRPLVPPNDPAWEGFEELNEGETEEHGHE